MNAQQIAAYEQLCAKVPEAKPADLFEGSFAGIKFASFDGLAIGPNALLAILTDHLERMLPEQAVLYWPDNAHNWFSYAIPDDRVFADPDRFVALCKAVEASR